MWLSPFAVCLVMQCAWAWQRPSVVSIIRAESFPGQLPFALNGRR
jgi:hypothetical protein